MATQYFSHDVNAHRDDKCVKLLHVLGWKGYGIFWGIIERMSERDDCVLAYNPADLAWSLRVTEKFLVRVLTEFDLFVFSEDGKYFWSESARRRLAMRTTKIKRATKTLNVDAIEEYSDEETSKKRRGRPRKNQDIDDSILSENVNKTQKVDIKESTVIENEKTEIIENSDDLRSESTAESTTKAETSEEHQEESTAVENQAVSSVPWDESETSKQTSEQSQNDEKTVIEDCSINDEQELDNVSDSIPVESIIAIWNKIFQGTKQTYHGLYLDAISFHRVKESFSIGFTLEDLEQAFEVAKNDSFSWLLKDVLKSDNIQRLLTKKDKRNEQKQINDNFRAHTASRASATDWELPDEWKQFERKQPSSTSFGATDLQ